MISLEISAHCTSYDELDKNKYRGPRTAQVAIVDHFKK